MFLNVDYTDALIFIPHFAMKQHPSFTILSTSDISVSNQSILLYLFTSLVESEAPNKLTYIVLMFSFLSSRDDEGLGQLHRLH